MPIAITDWHVELLRNYLRQDPDRFQPMLREMPNADEVDGSGVIMYAAFVEAVVRRFVGQTRGDVIRFVAHSRIRRGREAPPIDPAAAEKLSVAALDGGRAEGLTDLQRAQHVILLGELIEDEDPSESELEDFLATVRASAERLAATMP